MKNFFDLSTPAKRFRFVAIVEAVTWAALIVAMIVKRVADMDSAIRIPGMVHGIVFVIYVLLALLTARALKWNLKVLALALVASIPPFFTVWFEVWARRNGHLGELSAASATPDDERDKVSA